VYLMSNQLGQHIVMPLFGGGKILRLAVNKQRSHRFHMERFNLKKLNKLEDKEKYCVEVSCVSCFRRFECLGGY
jgi:hypothetical protein